MAVASDAGVDLLNAASTERLATLTGQQGYVSTVAFSDQGRLLASGSFDGTLRIWNIAQPRNPQLLGRIQVSDSRVDAIAVSPRDAVVAVTAGTGMAIYTLDAPARPQIAAVLTEVETIGTASGLAISPDGKLLAVSADNFTVRLYDIANPGAPARLATVRAGKSGGVTSLAISPDGSLLAAGGSDNTTRLWSLAERRRPRALGTMSDATFGVSAVAFSPDNAVLAAGDRGGAVRLGTSQIRSVPHSGRR